MHGKAESCEVSGLVNSTVTALFMKPPALQLPAVPWLWLVQFLQNWKITIGWWILYASGRVEVQHQSSTEGHRWLPFWWWPTQIFLFVYVCKWVARQKSLLEWWSAVVVTTDHYSGGGCHRQCCSGSAPPPPNSSSGGELKPYLGWKRNTLVVNGRRRQAIRWSDE